MYLTSYSILFPEQAARETRAVTVKGGGTLPDDEYGLLDSYCTDPTCHCRLVLLRVAARYQDRLVAAISYGFDRDDPLAGPDLDSLNPQAPYAPALLEIVKQVLADPIYTARLEAHYLQVKGAMADPQHPIHARLAAAEERIADGPVGPPPPGRRAGANRHVVGRPQRRKGDRGGAGR